jgi:hypothetical protein
MVNGYTDTKEIDMIPDAQLQTYYRYDPSKEWPCWNEDAHIYKNAIREMARELLVLRHPDKAEAEIVPQSTRAPVGEKKVYDPNSGIPLDIVTKSG